MISPTTFCSILRWLATIERGVRVYRFFGSVSALSTQHLYLLLLYLRRLVDGERAWVFTTRKGTGPLVMVGAELPKE